MEYGEKDEKRITLWLRWEVTFDWFGYSTSLKRLHTAMLVHRDPWSTRSLAEYTSLPHTSVRRCLDLLDSEGLIERVEAGVRLNDQGYQQASALHSAACEFVLGGQNFDKRLLDHLRSSQNAKMINFAKLENHIWRPDLSASGEAL